MTIGYLAWWNLAGVVISQNDLRRRLGAAGFALPPSRNASLSRLLVQAMERIPGAVGVRREGGVIFVPPAAHADLARLRTVLTRLPTTEDTPAALHLVPVADTREGRAEIAAAVTAGLMQDLAALGRELAHLQSKARTIRPDTLAERQVRLQALHDRAQLHAGLLTKAQRGVVTAAVAALARRLDEARAP
ncbi:MAG TPA: hypothetical protein VFS21_21370 [Roseiflexaceae bacterium]|nr:hypothetical protein [Roseiflexaceae bacterium]